MSNAEMNAVSGQFFIGGFQNVRGNVIVTAQGAPTAPCTSPATAAIIATNAATPALNLTMRQTAPALNDGTGGPVLSAYASAGSGANPAAQKANSLMVCRPSVSSASLAYPVGSIGGSGTGGAVAVVGGGGTVDVGCTQITAGSIVKVWLLGLPALAVAGGVTTVVAPPAVAINPGVGFTITALVGTTWGYEVMFA